MTDQGARHWIATAPAGSNVLVMQHVTYNAEVTQVYRDKGWRIEGPFVASSDAERAHVERMAPAVEFGADMAAERDRLRAENEALKARLAEAEKVVYGLCDAWDGDTPQVDDPGNVVFGAWLEAAGYHVTYRMNSSPAGPAPDEQEASNA